MSAAAVATESVAVGDDAGIRRITLTRPPLNIVDITMLHHLADAVESVPDAGIKVILLEGAGRRAFCAGVDVADHTPSRVGDMLEAFSRAVRALLGSRVPVVAALNGAALGGGFEIALSCDVVLARAGVAVGQPEIRLGVFPPVAAALLPRLAGRHVAMDLILSGRTIGAAEAQSLGIVAATYADEEFDAAVDAYIAGLTAHSAPVLRLARRAVLAGAEGALLDALAETDRIYLEELMILEDPVEGLAAFTTKRSPVWRDA
jgi:cyclohexa-1,5-dienecarbonyl-CoA hydratase